MKFAKELDRELVPEWRAKYVDYKLGKKKLKGVAKALKVLTRTPRTPRRSSLGLFTRASPSNAQGPDDPQDLRKTIARRNHSQHNLPSKTPPVQTRNAEHQPLTGSDEFAPPPMQRYGSIIGSPPPAEDAEHQLRSQPSYGTLSLPDPAMDPHKMTPVSTHQSLSKQQTRASIALPEPAVGDNAFEVGKTVSPVAPHQRSPFVPKRLHSSPATGVKRPLYQRMLSIGGRSPSAGTPSDVPLDVYREVDFRQAEFFIFLDKELDKVEKFYKEKEDQATARLSVLREQLHIMRDSRLDDILRIQEARKKASRKSNDYILVNNRDEDEANEPLKESRPSVKWLNPFQAARKVNETNYSRKNLKSLKELGTPRALRPQTRDLSRDYSKRFSTSKVPYRTAKRKLKIALHEYYRGLELLKSYALLNRTAFKKINKKYDKTAHARPTGRYMSEKVNKAYFVTSGVLEGHLQAVEDLYARYFEQGNHKSAVNKLRTKAHLVRDFTGSTFRNGFFVAAGVIFGGEGLAKGIHLMHHSDPWNSAATNFLLQIYGGYFLVLLLVALFCLVCRVWDRAKINYSFVFEFDNRHQLDWRQLFEFPCFFFFLACFTMWLNFSRIGGSHMFTYWPVVLLSITLIILISPLPILSHKTREWFLYSLWRVMFAGLYAVEFRDFFFGDMLCSLTYTMSNIALFFCLYTYEFNDPAQCNTSNFWVGGLMSCLPGAWRGLQCLRRYRDTRDTFPHLVNGGKYLATVMFYLSFSLYRLDKASNPKYVAFVFFATVNAVYTSIWDIFMDWSLGDWYADNWFLRPVLGYKNVWIYYAAMIIDPIIRFNWVLYAIYANEIQHSALLSYMVSVSEVCRRGMWTVFRVENEHCTNVTRFRASRDIALPYDVHGSVSEPITEDREEEEVPPSSTTPADTGHATGIDVEQAVGTPRNRRQSSQQPSPAMRAFRRVGNIVRLAHAQDFERKKRPEIGETQAEDDTDDDDDDDDDTDGDKDTAKANGDSTMSGANNRYQRTASQIEDEADIMEAQRLVGNGERS